MAIENTTGARVLCCYSRKDKELAYELKAHLTVLRRQGLVTWHDLQIEVSKEKEEDAHLEINGAQIILLLISQAFMASGYWHEPEMEEIMAMRGRTNVHVIPIKLYKVRLRGTLFEQFQQLPPLKGKPPIMEWINHHEAFYEVAKAIRGFITEPVLKQDAHEPEVATLPSVAVTAVPSETTGLGAHLLPDGAGASFRLWAPNASAVNVLLRANPEDPCTRLALGLDSVNPEYWSADISGVAVGNAYQFEITNRGGSRYNPGGPSFLRTDPCARQVTSSVPTSPALIVDPIAFRFTAPFQTPAFGNFIIYQAHIGSFAGRNDDHLVALDVNDGTASFDQFQSKLDYIRSMNFNAIQFSPNGEYRGSGGEAYNPPHYYAPDALYGTPDDLRRLIDACHCRGLAVFLDVVYNHMASTHNLWQFDGNTDHRSYERNPWTGGGIYLSTVETGFGRRPDHDSPDVQRFFYENAAMWFNEYHVDGLRFDSVENFSEQGLKAIVQKLVTDFPKKFISAECGDPSYVFNTLGFRACWDVGSADTFARVISNGDLFELQALVGRFGYPTASSAIKYLLGSHDQIYNRWSYDEKRREWAWDKPGHDSLWENRYFVEKIGGAVTGRDNWYARALARMGWALNVALPCTPLLFMGSECHHYGYWNPEIDAFGDHRFDWHIAGDQIGWEMRRMVRDVNAVRWNHPALRSDIIPEFPHFDLHNRVLAFKRWNNTGDVLLIVVNVSDNQWNNPIYGVNVGGAGDRWVEIFNSQAPQYGGWRDSGNYLADLRVDPDGQFRIRLPKWSVLMFHKI